jgi:hypothetical protein
MALQKLLLPVDLTGGLDTKNDQFLTAGLTELENGVFTVGSRISKRKGYTSLPRKQFGGSTLTFEGVAGFQKELLAYGSSRLYAYSDGQAQWADRGGYLNVGVAEDDVIRQNQDVVNPDSCMAGGLILYAWEQYDVNGASQGVYYSVVDAASFAILASRVLISATGKHPRCCQLGTKFAVAFVETAGTDSVKTALITEGDLESFTLNTIGADADTTNPWIDVAVYSTDTTTGRCVYAYKTSTANTIAVGYIVNNGGVGGPSYGTASPTTLALDAEDGVAIVADQVSTNAAYAGRIYVANWKNSDGSGLKVTSFTSGLATGSTYTIEATSTEIDSVSMIVASEGVLTVIYGKHAVNTYDHSIWKNTLTISSGTVGTASTVKRSLGLMSKVFAYNGSIYVLGVHDSDLQPTYFLIDTDGLIVAKSLPGRAGTLPETSMASSVIQYDSTTFQIAGQVRTRLVSVNNDLYSLKGMSRLEFDFSETSKFQGQELGDNLHIAGGFLQMYDSSNIVEHGFHLYPENVTGTVTSSGGGSSSGSYSWRVVYRWIDEHGQIHRSAPSVALSKTLSSNNYVTLTIPTLRLTAKTGVVIDVYRTVAAGTLYFKVGSVNNNTTANSVTFADGNAGATADAAVAWVSDADLVAKESLYTNGGEIENIACPATKVLGRFAGRLWAVSSENPTELVYSKRRLPLGAVEFTDTFRIILNKAVEITALKEMDEKLIIFERDAIYYITGQGPTVTGDQNDFSSAQLITSDVGCINTASMVLMPLGLMFQSAKGIYLLNRSLETVYIGAPVESYNGLTVTSAELIDDENQIRFLTGSECLVFDYFYGKWSVFTNHAGSGAITWKANNKYVYLRTDGRVFQQADTYLDDNATISMRITTGWIKTNGVQGLQRTRRAFVLGDWASNHTLRTQVAYDYEQFFNEQHTWNYITALGVTDYGDVTPYGQEVYGGLGSATYQFRMHLQQQKNQSVRFRIEDVSSSGEAYSISSLMLEVGVKGTSAKLQAARLT